MGEGKVVIRRLGPEEVMDVHALWKEAGLEFRPEGRDSVGHMTKELQAGTLVMGGAYIGEALLAVVLMTDDGRKGWINRLAVRPAYRGKGLGRQLIHFCEMLMKSKGLGMTCCLIEDWNEASLALFQSEGYELRKDIFYLRKTLNGQDW
jgi:GNAT superfamily N-acetyltransferase